MRGSAIAAECTGKFAFPSRAVAIDAIKQSIRKRRKRTGATIKRGPLGTYRCPVCHSWHIGNRETNGPGLVKEDAS